MRKITVDSVFATYSDELINEVLYRIKSRVYSALEVLAEREDMIEAGDFFYHFYYHAPHMGIKRIAKLYGMEERELNCLVRYFYPEGFYYHASRLMS